MAGESSEDKIIKVSTLKHATEKLISLIDGKVDAGAAIESLEVNGVKATIANGAATVTIPVGEGGTSVQADWNATSGASAIQNKPETFTPSEHTHETSDVTGLDTALAGKVDAVDGKGLSTNDYTTDDMNKLSGIEEGAEKNVQSDWTATE